MGIILRALVVLLTFTGINAFAADKDVEVIGGQELLVFAKSGVSSSSFASNASQQMYAFGSQLQLKLLTPKVGVVAFGSTSGSTHIAKESSLLAACDRIKNSQVGCEINHLVKSFKTSNDNYYSALAGLTKISAPAAWDITTGSKSVKVAVVDTGVDYNHPDLAANISVNSSEIPGNNIDDDGNGKIDDYYGYDFANSDADPMDDNNHGTHVSGTIGAVGDNVTGVVGVNWSVGIVPVKVLSGSGSGSTAGVIAGIDYAIARGVQVINMSLGGAGYSQAFFDSIQRANAAGVLVVAAAGNENNNNDGAAPSYPASFNLPNIVSVAATTSADTRASFSNYGATSVDLAAPGVSILSTLPGSLYGSFSGTSMACPHVAGAAALVKAANPALSMLQVKDALLNNVDIVSSLNGLVATGGRLNVARAVQAVSGITPAPPAPAPQPTSVPNDPPGNDDGDDNGGDDGGGGGGGTDPGDDPEVPQVLTYVDVDATVKLKKATIVSLVLDQDDYEIAGVTVSLVCANKKVGTKYTDSYGESTFT